MTAPQPDSRTMRAAVSALLEYLHPEPRVWPRGAGQPKPDVPPRAVIDGDGILWQLDQNDNSWWSADSDNTGQGWGMLTCDGPLVEVTLPQAVRE
jgi:hypothetical protein